MLLRVALRLVVLRVILECRSVLCCDGCCLCCVVLWCCIVLSFLVALSCGLVLSCVIRCDLLQCVELSRLLFEFCSGCVVLCVFCLGGF